MLTKKIQYGRAIDQNDKRWNEFQKAYQLKYAKNPGPAQAFVYDGIMLAIDAIRKNGPDPEALRQGFKSMKYPGITGEIKFGELGNREIGLVLSN